MITDIYTILWKELKELVLQQGAQRGGWLRLAIFLGVFGVFMPLQSGREWVTSPLNLVFWAWLPFLLVSSVIADSFAGERERHTLETLLASRLSDRAILFGKILAGIVYGWGLTILSILLSLVTVNIAFGQGSLLLYPADIAAGIIGISFLISAMASGLGVLVSLRASTVRQAQQTFSIAFFLLFIPLFLLPLLPREWQVRLAEIMTGANIGPLIIGLIVFIVAIDFLLIFMAMARFKRSKLILD